MGMHRYVPIDEIHRRSKKKGICSKRVEALRRAIEAGQDTHPVRLHQLADGTYTIEDGRHRIKAHVAAGIHIIYAYIVNAAKSIKRFLHNIITLNRLRAVFSNLVIAWTLIRRDWNQILVELGQWAKFGREVEREEVYTAH